MGDYERLQDLPSRPLRIYWKTFISVKMDREYLFNVIEGNITEIRSDIKEIQSDDILMVEILHATLSSFKG